MTSWTHMVHAFLLVHLCMMICLGSKLLVLATQNDNKCTYTKFSTIFDANCHGQELTTIPSGCEDATTLHLGSNNITINHDTFTRFNHLKVLYLRDNSLESLDEGVFHPIATTIQTLDLSSNKIQRLENNTFVNMTQLEQLDMRGNGIVFIAVDAFQNLPSLELLSLTDNLIEFLPPAVFDEMSTLQQLYLENNKIRHFDSRTLLNLNSLAGLFLRNNSITSLTGSSLQSNMQIQKIDISLNNIEEFDCQWTNDMSTLMSVDLSQNHIQSIPNCKSYLGILTLTDNPFDCGCTSIMVTSWFLANPNLTSPICGSPPGKQGQKVRDVSFEECFTSPSPTEKVTSRLLTTQTTHRKFTTGRTEYMTTAKTTIDLDSINKVKGGYAASPKELLFSNRNVFVYTIIGFAFLIILILILIFILLLKHRRHSRNQKNSSHYMTTITNSSLPNTPTSSNAPFLPHVPSIPNTPNYPNIPALPNTPPIPNVTYQQNGTSTGTRNSSHLYATIGDRRHTGDFTPTGSTHHVELIREDTSSANGLPNTRRQSDALYRDHRDRAGNMSTQDPNFYLSDSQDSGLADQGLNRDSVTEWLLLHGGIHYLQIHDGQERSATAQSAETVPPTLHPMPPAHVSQGEDHRIPPEMVTLLNSPCLQQGGCHNNQCVTCMEDPSISHMTTFRLERLSKARPSSGIYVPHHVY